MTGEVIIDTMLWTLVGSLAGLCLCGLSVLAVLTVKTIIKILKD
jgi:hypothetical protein